MDDDTFRRLIAGIGPRRVVVLSDRYPPDVGGGAEISLHLLLREPPLREQVLVVTFDKSIGEPLRRAIEGVEVLALPADAAWPLHRLSQHEVDRAKRMSSVKRWSVFLGEALAGLISAPAINAQAHLCQLLGGGPRGGLRMDHATTPASPTRRRLVAILDGLAPELVHADNARAIMMAASVLKGRTEPFVALVRDHRFTTFDFDQTSAAAERDGASLKDRLATRCAEAALIFRRKCLERAATVVVTSDHLATSLTDVRRSDRLRQLPFEPAEIPDVARKGPCDAFKILLVGSLTEKKGQSRLIEAWPEILSKIPNATIDVAGKGEQRAEIEALVTRLGAGSRVRLHGHADWKTLARLYGECDVVAVPTLWSEPFGRTPIEAGAAGKPVVAYASGGLSETVVDGVTGRLVPAGDIAAFIAALADLSQNPEARRRMGEEGQERARTFHRPDELANMLARLWNETIASAKARAA